MSKSTITSRRNLRAATRLVHSGRNSFDYHGFVNTPQYRGSTVLFESVEALQNLRAQTYTYGTKGTPTTKALCEAWTEIAGAKGTVLVPSGLAGVALALLTATKTGDHILVVDAIYGPTRNFCTSILERYGVKCEFFSPLEGDGLRRRLRPNTSVILVESPCSLTMEVLDIPYIATLAHEHGVTIAMDNTWATSLHFSPHKMGVDIVIEAGTKYLSGHADLLLGLVSANDKWFPKLRHTFDAMAICAGADDVFLALRGLRTLHLRMQAASSSSLILAQWLKERPEVKRVIYPPLVGDDSYTLWKRDFTGAAGLFSVEFQPGFASKVAEFVDHLQLFGIGYSWGGYESLVIPFDPRHTTTKDTPGSLAGKYLRFSLGLEDVEDLINDLEKAFTAVE